MKDDRLKPPEPWLTKPQLAEHLAVSDRWIELQQRVGLPYLRMDGLSATSSSPAPPRRAKPTQAG